MVRIILVDDHDLFRNGIRLLLETIEGYQVVAEFDNSIGVLEACEASDINLVILDYSMPGGGSVATLSALKSGHLNTKVIALTGVRSGTVFRQLQANGADGIVFKDAQSQELVDVIDRVLSGEKVLSESVSQNLYKGKPDLTPREFQILEMIVSGLNTREMVARLNISIKTIETHRASISHKLGVNNVVELIHHVRAHGILEE